MAQWVKVLAAKPDDPASIPGTCIGENTFLQLFLDFKIHSMAELPPPPKTR
ncbi:hypothetical protein I79_026206 [Cricetulus griseus]|uniref:Uncharacterized protein n=1 Tax=Cricetulus griseus TaxID=10029 RepID=G3IQA2_CRIGR|nr:hypothetical protein I79_026206 [Cricetulus griseus]